MTATMPYLQMAVANFVSEDAGAASAASAGTAEQQPSNGKGKGGSKMFARDWQQLVRERTPAEVKRAEQIAERSKAKRAVKDSLRQEMASDAGMACLKDLHDQGGKHEFKHTHHDTERAGDCDFLEGL
jgi:hypothetical protein